MDEQEPQEAHSELWERYMEAERQELQMRRESHLAKILDPALPTSRPRSSSSWQRRTGSGPKRACWSLSTRAGRLPTST